MAAKLFLCFTLIPAAELALLIYLGGIMGLWPTLGVILLTGALGAWLARAQGMRTMMRIQENMAQGITPAAEMVDGLLILVAGVVLITPGFLTDLAGFLLLIPFVRSSLRKALRARFEKWARQGRVTVTRFP